MKDLITVKEYCDKYNKDPGNVRRLLISGRIKGEKIGNQWVIKASQKPVVDKRIKTGKYVNFKINNFKKENKSLIEIIKKMNKEICNEYNGLVTKIVIYGSYARNKQNDESDVDIAIFVKKDINRDKLIEISSKYENKIGKVLSIIDINEDEYNKYKNTLPFYSNIRKEGITI